MNDDIRLNGQEKGSKKLLIAAGVIILALSGTVFYLLMKPAKMAETPPPAAEAPKAAQDDFFADVGGSKTTTPGPAPKGERKILFYRNPMTATITSPVPARDDMGMDYIPVYADEAEGVSAGGVEGLATIRVGEEALSLSGVQTAEAVRDEVARTVRTVGIVVPDETRIRRVQTKVEGWIERLYVNVTGQAVSRGQPLLSIYSPELLASQEEFLRAREAARKFGSSASPDVKSLGDELLRSARRRLELYDVPRGFIDELEKTGVPQRSVTLNSPAGGYVIAKDVFEGQKVEPGMELLSVVDLSRVWIEADLYEYEASAVKVGQEASLSLSFDPSVKLRGKVTFVNPFLSADSRTLKVRFEFPNPKIMLKPQMYADVTLSLDTSRGVVIPDSAIIDTGIRKVVFVETGKGLFEPREVRIGVRGEGRAEVLSGVGEGEKVAVKANFLLDSESRLRAAIIRMTGGGAR
ncbi:efflux RND transporter periplasmic adaptor subunit [bacterium]|nr:MAG: efflux RND transporter periplasmic adaptor subunit [bacterium]